MSIADLDLCLQSSSSELERDFWSAVYFKSVGIRDKLFNIVEPQYKVGRYRIDGVFGFRGKMVGVELDGRSFHDEERDYKRDSEILSSGKVNEIIRIPFSSMTYFRDGVLKALSEWHPEFSMRAWDLSIMDWSEFQSEFESLTESIPHSFLSEEKAMEWCNKTLDIVEVSDSEAWVCSPSTMAAVKAGSSKQIPITRRVA